jgi:hypothetical protein
MMYLLLSGIASLFVLLYSAKTVTGEHVNAQPLGKLVYHDVSISIEKEKAQQALIFLEEDLSVLMTVLWKDGDKEGIDPKTPISITLKNQPALIVLERIVGQLDPQGGASWQLRHGALEVGLKSQLASRGRQRLETYYIRDLLITIRNFGAPELGNFGDGEQSESLKQEEINRIIDLIVKLVEPELWEQNGGSCSITNYKTTLLIRAPDFVHRQINGYSFKPTKPENVRERKVIFSKENSRVIVDRLPHR